MTLRLLLDECAHSHRLHHLLRDEGHEVVIPREVGLSGEDDEVVFAYAREHDLAVLTKNPRDFEFLHALHPSHAGIFAVYQDNDPKRDLADLDIVRALTNLLMSGVPLPNEVHNLNHWYY